MNNHSTLKAILALGGGHLHQGLELQDRDILQISLIRNNEQLDLFRLPHHSVNEDGSLEPISSIMIDVHISEIKGSKCTCPPSDATHTPPCIYYAPSSQEIYRESVQ